jgi:D-3-phosphoglycerate dehydrogenase
MAKEPILFINSNYPPILDELKSRYEVFHYWVAKDKEALVAEAAKSVRAIFSNESSWVPHLMDALPKLEIIALASTGYEKFDIATAKSRGIRITSAPSVAAGDVADLAIGLMLAAARRITWAERYLRAGKWVSEGRAPMSTRFYGKKLGILGLGAIGTATARRAQGFDMEICYHGRRRQPDVPYRYYANLLEMAADVDFLAVTCPGGPTTAGIVSAEVLKALGPTGIVVNVARGTCIDEPALIQALRGGTLGGAGIDVFTVDPDDGTRFAGMDNVVLTPHIGTGTPDTRREMNMAALENLEAFFAGRPLPSPIPEIPN